MDENKIYAHFLWLPITQPHPNVESIRSVLKKHQNVDFRYQRSTVKSSNELYDETAYKFNLEFDIPELKNSSQFYDLILLKWCQAITQEPHACLQIPLKDPAQNPYEFSREPLKAKAFGLGSFFGLNVFYSHFSSENKIEKPLKNANPNHLNSKKNVSAIKKIYLSNISITFDIERRRLLAHFFCTQTAGEKKTSTKYYFAINFDQLKSIMVHKSKVKPMAQETTTTLYLQMESSLVLFKGTSTDTLRNFIYDNKVKKRVTDIGDEKDVLCPENIIGNSRCLQLVLPHSEAIDNFLIQSKSNYFFGHVKVIHVKPCQKILLTLPATKSGFESFYALQSVLKRGFDINDQFVDKPEEKVDSINQKLLKMSTENQTALTHVLYNIYSALDKGNHIVFENALEKLFKVYQEKLNPGYVNDANDPKAAKLVRRAIITPTKILLLPPTPSLDNRVFIELDSDAGPEYALRVHIRDDDNRLLSHSVYTKLTENEMYLEETENDYLEDDNIQTVKSKIGEEEKYKANFFSKKIAPKLKMLKIGPRNYEFVGCSSSQLKDNGFLMYARNGDNSAQKIRTLIGELDEIKKVSKYIARMGQGFSQIDGYIKVDKRYVNVEKDIEDGFYNGEPYVFSDGIGKISKDLVNEIYDELKESGVKLGKTPPSASQIRYGGCKGMLVLDPTLKGKEIIFRKSMSKFESQSEILAIVGYSKPEPVFLNRTFISILEQMGIPRDVFLNYQFETLTNFYQAFVDEDVACDFLKSSCELKLPFARLKENGVSLISEPFFRALLEAIVKQRLKNLKEKAKIKISPERGRNMYGVLDETRTLKYGEVFFQYSNDVTDFNNEGPFTVYEGDVIVTKNPCNRLGDVRKLKAVKKDKLMHIKDCIVFPSLGRRPHPNEMAGSDLDGDQYVVIWDKDLIFQSDSYPPSDFPSFKKNDLDHPVEVSDMIEFIGEYILNENIGLIAKAHLAYADSEGLKSKVCQRLAELYSISLDFSKSGVPAKLNDIQQPRQWPDFMTQEKDFYVSKNVLGQLFRNCRRLENCLASVVSDFQFEPNPDFIHEGWRNYEKEALEELREYQIKIKQLLQHYAVNTEGELMSGAIIKYTRAFTAKDEDYDFHRIISKHMNSLFKNIRHILSGLENQEEELKFTSAIYMVTATMNNESFFGLPWGLHENLLKLKTRNQSKRETRPKPLYQTLDTLFPKPCTLMELKETYRNIIKTWLKKNTDFFKSIGLRREHVKDTVTEALDTVLRDMNPKSKYFSPGANLMDIFEKIITLCLTTAEDSKIRFKKSLSLLCIITLTRLAMSHDLSVLCDDQQSTMMVLTFEEWEIVKIFLKDKNLHSLMKYEEEVKAFLLRCVKLSEIVIDYDRDTYCRKEKKKWPSQNYSNEMNGRSKNGYNGWSQPGRKHTNGMNAKFHTGFKKEEDVPEYIETCICFFKIKGNSFYRECFKDLVGQPWFQKAVYERKLPQL